MAKKRFTIQGSSAEVTSFLQTVAKSDQVAEKASNQGKWFLGFVCLTWVITISVGGLNQWDMPNFVWYTLGGLALLGLVMAVWGSSKDVDNDRYETLHRMHRFLSHDCHPATLYRYTMDLRDYDHRAFFKGLGPGWGLFTWVSRYQCPVLEARVKMRDGTHLLISHRCRCKKTSKTRLKFGRSGKLKLKSKSKFKYTDDTEVRVKLPQGAPPPPERPVEPSGMARLYGSGDAPQYSAKGQLVKTRLVERDSGKGLKSDNLLWLLAWTFRQLQPADNVKAS